MPKTAQIDPCIFVQLARTNQIRKALHQRGYKDTDITTCLSNPHIIEFIDTFIEYHDKLFPKFQPYFPYPQQAIINLAAGENGQLNLFNMNLYFNTLIDMGYTAEQILSYGSKPNGWEFLENIIIYISTIARLLYVSLQQQEDISALIPESPRLLNALTTSELGLYTQSASMGEPLPTLESNLEPASNDYAGPLPTFFTQPNLGPNQPTSEQATYDTLFLPEYEWMP